MLHAACYYGHIKFVELLFENQADVEIADTWYGGRPLAWACFGGHFKLCKLLIEKYGAERNAENLHGQVAFDLVAEQNSIQWKVLFNRIAPPAERRAAAALDKRTPVPDRRGSITTVRTPATSERIPKTPVMIKIPPSDKSYSVQKPVSQIYQQTPSNSRFVQPLPVSKSSRRNEPRRVVPFTTPNYYATPMPQKQTQMPSQFALYMAQGREPSPQIHMVESLGILK